MITRTEPITDRSIREAADILLGGGIIGMPTETVYGLAAIGTNSEAVKKIYEAKGRPSDNPLIAHIHKDYDLNKLVYIDNDYAGELFCAYSPGPLTLVFRSRGVICKEAVCGGDTLAVRIPSHEGCQRLLREVDAPLVAPSANISKHTSPVTAAHVLHDMNGKIPLILDGGKCSGGIESTVVDVTGDVPRILRAGLVTKEMIEKITGKCEIAMHGETDKVRSPGVKYAHYRPDCQTALFREDQLEKVKELYDKYIKEGKKPYVLCSDRVADKLGNLNFLRLGKDDKEIAANLYCRLLEGEKKADIIIAVEMPDEKGVNLGIMNRMRKSCG